MPLPLVAIAAVVSAAASVGGAVKGGIDADKKRNIEQQLTFLNNDQKLKLEKQLREAKSEEERLKILGDTLNVIAAARVQGLSVVQVEKEKTKKQLLIVGIAAASLLVITLLFISRKK
jgi:hypothetical protein